MSREAELHRELKIAFDRLTESTKSNRELRLANRNLKAQLDMSVNGSTAQALSSSSTAPQLNLNPTVTVDNSMTHIGFPLNTIPKFSGTSYGPINEWLENFDKITSGLGMAENKQAEIIRLFLSGPAEQIYSEYDDQVKNNYRTLYAKLLSNISRI